MMAVARKSVLVVEDERVVAKDLQRSLENLGYEAFETAATAEDALRLAEERRPDVVLMDIRIKGKRDGIETADLLKSRMDVAIIYLTAYADEETVERAKKTEPYGYLLKPVRPEKLRSAVEVALYKHETERRLRDRERWFSTTLRAIRDVVIAVDASGSIRILNRAAESLLSVSESAAAGLPLAQFVRLIDEVKREEIPDLAERALAGHRIVESPSGVAILAGATERPVEVSSAPILDDGGSALGALVVLRDMGSERELQRKLSLSERLASIGTLAAGVAHEINNPLAVIVANASFLSDAVTHGLEASSPDDVLEAVRHLEEAAERVRRIVADLRVFARPQEAMAGSCDVCAAVEWATRVTASEIGARARLVTDLQPVPLVAADDVRIGQVIVNLLVNAAHAIPEGKPGDHEIRVSTGRDDAGRIVLTVSDTGDGIPADVIPRIFDPFFTTKGVGSGSGLGLSICHGILRSIGGEITVDSIVGQGTTFRVLLPAVGETRHLVALEPSIPPPTHEGPTIRARILVVDDEALILRAVQRSLGKYHDVVVFSDPTLALAALEERSDFDIVLCDLIMPGVSGMDFFREVSRRSPELAERFVFLTGGAYTKQATDFLAEVANPRLEKPFLPADLRGFVHTLMLGRSSG